MGKIWRNRPFYCSSANRSKNAMLCTYCWIEFFLFYFFLFFKNWFFKSSNKDQISKRRHFFINRDTLHTAFVSQNISILVNIYRSQAYCVIFFQISGYCLRCWIWRSTLWHLCWRCGFLCWFRRCLYSHHLWVPWFGWRI